MIAESKEDVPKPERGRSSLGLLLWIMAGVLVWGTIHAVGVYVSSSEPNILKPIIVYGCVLGFLGFWAALLWNKNHSGN